MIREYCPRCGKELVKPNGWNFFACVNRYCANYPAHNFIGNTEIAILFEMKNAKWKSGVKIND